MFKKKEGENATQEDILEVQADLNNFENEIKKENRRIEAKIRKGLLKTKNESQELLKNLEEKLTQKIQNNQKKTLERENELKENLIQEFSILKKKVESLDTKVDDIDNKLARSQEDIKEHIKNQEEIIMDMIKKFNDELLSYKNKFISDLDDLRSEQDILKISYSINEKKLLQKMKSEIHKEMNEAVKNKEKEILMNLWINELKEIITNFEDLKKMNPKEFKIQINEICSVIDTFKQELEH
jgi:hypothetical protein